MMGKILRLGIIYNIVFCFFKAVYYKLFERIYLYLIRLKTQNNVYDPEPLVSIIIATYNRAEILANRTIPSVLNQTYKNIEVVIVGDKCIDNTPEILLNFPDSRVRFYDLDKRGKYPVDIRDRWFVQGSVPRNFGMKIAKGEWFVFISDDDIMLPHHVETLLKFVIKEKAEFISASYETIKNGNKLVVTPQPFGRERILVGGMQTWLYKSYLKRFKWNVDSWRKNYNRPVDYDLQLRFIQAKVRMTSVNEIVYFNPPVEGTNTTGYEAAILAESLNHV